MFGAPGRRSIVRFKRFVATSTVAVRSATLRPLDSGWAGLVLLQRPYWRRQRKRVWSLIPIFLQPWTIDIP
jgi:hypothetical protein